MFILCHICKLSFPQMYHYIILRFLRCSIHFIFVNVLYSNLSQSRICSYLISPESWGYSFCTRVLQEKKKNQQLKFTVDKGVYSSSFHACSDVNNGFLDMNQRRLLIHWLASCCNVTYLCQCFLNMLVQFSLSLNKIWGVNFTLEIYFTSVREVLFPSERHYLWDWVRFHAEKRSKEI